MREKKAKPLNFNTPLLSIKGLLRLLEINKDERVNAITLATMIMKERIRLKAGADGSEHILQFGYELVNRLSNKAAKELSQILAEMETNLDSFLRAQKEVFYSIDDAVLDMIKEKRIPAKLVHTMLGGNWPEHPFNFCCIYNFIIEEDGTLVPNDGMGEPAPGPDFKLSMVSDPLDFFKGE
jgi:hypothetical protein